MYNLRIKNISSLCTCARVSLFEKCIDSPFFFDEDKPEDMVLFGFLCLQDVKKEKRKIESFLSDFCFLCADCFSTFQIIIEKDK